MFLGALGEDKEHWILETKKERAEYAMLLDRYKPNRPTEQLSGDPLRDDGEKNGWGQKFRDEGMVYLQVKFSLRIRQCSMSMSLS